LSHKGKEQPAKKSRLFAGAMRKTEGLSLLGGYCLPGRNGGGTGGAMSGVLAGAFVGGAACGDGILILEGNGISSGLSAGELLNGACSGALGGSGATGLA
jgi:hypothetical protein